MSDFMRFQRAASDNGKEEEEEEEVIRRVPVLLPYPLQGPFDYRVPPNLHLQPGDVVVVPLNRREEVGVVWYHGADDAVPDLKLKPVMALVELQGTSLPNSSATTRPSMASLSGVAVPWKLT